MNWRKCFNSEIIERGEDYYRSGMVDDLAHDAAGNFCAQVHGSSDYNVRVRLNINREICDFECDCPHFSDGNNCKHIAAVLLKWEDENQSSRHEVRHTKLRTIPELRQEIANLRWTYSGSSNHIEYWQAYEFLQKMLSILNVDVANFLDHGQFTEALKLTEILLENFSHINIDDDDKLGEFCAYIFESWEKIYRATDDEFHCSMFEWFAGQMKASSFENINTDFIVDSILDFWNSYFESTEFYELKLSVFDTQITKALQNDDLSLRDFELERWLSAKVELVKKSNSDDNIENFYLENWQYDYLKRSYIDWLMQQKQYDEAIQAIRQIVETEEINADDRKYYYNQMDFIYHYLNDDIMRRNCLMELIRMGDKVPEHFAAIKTLYHVDEWPEVCRKIIRQVPTAHERAALYCREKFYQELYDEVAHDRSRMLLQNYSNFLSKKYPTEILTMYKELLNEEASNSTGREHYRKLASLLRRVKRLPGGEATTRELLDDWRSKYKNRRAMWEELGVK